MSPKQGTHNYLAEVNANGASYIVATERLDGRLGGTFELMRFALRQLNEHFERVYELETSAATVTDAVAAMATANDVLRARRHMLLDSLVDMAHVAHHFLRHNDPDVRQAAEVLTTGTAHLIGRMYTTFAPATSILRM